MDDSLKEQIILRDLIKTRHGLELDDNQFGKFYANYQSSKKGFVGDIADRAKAGLKSGIASGQVILGDEEGAAKNIQEANELRTADPLLQERIQDITDSTSIGETLVGLAKDPKAATALLAESLPVSIAAGAAAIPAGRAVQAVAKAGPAVARIAGSGIFGGITGASEYGSTILQTLSENGVNITDPNQIQAVLEDPEIGDELRKRGLERGVPIAAFDAVSFGIAGKLAGLGKGGLAAEAGAQAALGGAGEASAQLVSEGEITDPAAIGLEIGLEAATGAPQAIIQPTLENLLQSTQQPSSSNSSPIEASGTDPSAIIAEITAIDPETNQPSADGAKTEEELPKDKQLEKQVNQARNLQFPKEVARGTPVQMSNRLMRLSKTDLADRAVNNASIPAETVENLSKREIVNEILNQFNIDTTKRDTVQTPSQAVPVPQSTNPPIPEALKGMNEPTRRDILKIAKKQPDPKQFPTQEAFTTERQKFDQANNVLSQLPDNVALERTLSGLSRNKGGTNFTGASLEQANQAIKKIKSPNTKDDTKVKATADLVKNLRDTGYFAPDEVRTLEGKNPELTKYVQKQLETGNEEGTKELVTDLLSNPRTRNTIIGEMFNDFKEGRQQKVDTPTLNRLGKKYARMINRQIEVPQNRLARDEDKNPAQEIRDNVSAAEQISEYESLKTIQVMKENNDIPSAVLKPENYDLDRDAYKRSAVTSTYKSALRSFDFMKTMGAIAREQPIFAPFFQLYRAKDSFREQLSRGHINDMIFLKEQYGIKRLEGAAAVLDIMTGPQNRQGPQPLQTNEAGQIRFKDVDGTGRVVDLETSKAIQDLQKLFKQQILVEMETFKSRAAETYEFDPNAQRSDMLDRIDELVALGEDGRARKLEQIVEHFDTMEKLYRSNKAYMPHTRNRGPFAIAVYRQNEDGARELAGLYNVKADKFGNIDSTDERAVRERIQRDQETFGESFTSFSGDPVTAAPSFLMTYENLRKNVMRDAKNPNIAYEALANLLTNKNINPEELNKVFDELSFDSDTERFFVNYRDKKNYYGYDNEDFLSSMLDSLNSRSTMLTRFQYNQPLAELKAQADNDLQRLGRGGQKSQRQLDEYYDYMSSPADDAAKIREFTFWYFLAGNPSTSLLQLMSTYMNTLPWLSQYQGPVGFIKSNLKSVTTSLYKASVIQKNKNLLTPRTIPEFARRTKMSEEDSKVLLTLYERGILDPGYAIDAVNYSRNQEKQRKIIRGEKGLPMGLETVRNVGQGMIQVTEDIARMNSALLMLDSIKGSKKFEKIGTLLYNNDPLFKQLVKSKYEGKITKEAILEHGIDENHAIFGKNPRPSGLRSRTGAGLFAFLQYPISILEQMIRLLTTRGVAGKKAALNMIITYPLLFGGMTAIPGYETWDWMTKWIQRLTGGGRGPTNLDLVLTGAMEELGITNPTAKDLIMKGSVLSGGADIDASSRIAVQFPLQPFLDIIMSPESNGMTSQSQALQFLGPLATIPTGVLNMLNRVEGGANAGEAFVDSLAPVWLRNIKKAEDLRTGELRNTRGKRLIEGPQENPELYGDGAADEYIKQFIGLRPAVVSEASRAHYFQSVQQNAEKAAMTNEYSKVARALISLRAGKEGARQEYAEAMLEAWKTNKESDNPKTRKEFMSSLKQSIRARVESEENPLKQRRPINKDRKLSETVVEAGLPRLIGQVQDKD